MFRFISGLLALNLLTKLEEYNAHHQLNKKRHPYDHPLVLQILQGCLHC